jgi:rSAM/selenodomain-associated transferase 1
MNSNLLLIFTRKPVLGQCKTRLAKTVGDQAALDIYKLLLEHTAKTSAKVHAHKQVWYTKAVVDDDCWDNCIFNKQLQPEGDLGEKMAYAFQQGFSEGFKRIVVIGSDLYDLEVSDIQDAFQALYTHDAVIGPATDGGYYLLGLSRMCTSVFKNKSWGMSSVFEATTEDLKPYKLHVLSPKNDVDYYEDIAGISIFEEIIKQNQ